MGLDLVHARACAPAAYLVQLERFVALHDAAGAKREQQGKVGAVAYGVLVVWLTWKLFHWLRRLFDADLSFYDMEELTGALMFAGFFGVPALYYGLPKIWQWAKDPRDEHERAKQAIAFLRSLARDLHPKVRLAGKLDLGEARVVAAHETKTSRMSGATKTYHRKPWFVLRGVMADGVQFSVRITDVLQVKAGAERKRTHKVRVQLRVPAAKLRRGLGGLPPGVEQAAVGEDVVFTSRREGDELEPLLDALPRLHGWLSGRRGTKAAR